MASSRRFIWFGLVIISLFLLHCCDAWWMQFYKETDFNELEAEVDDIITNDGVIVPATGCHFLEYIRGIHSNTLCIRVYFQKGSEGSWSQYPVVSFRTCTPEEEDIQKESLDSTRCRFYGDFNFQGCGSFTELKWTNGPMDRRINKCITLSPQSQNRASSIVSTSCIYLFDERECSGNIYVVSSRTKPSLKTVSFRGCSPPTAGDGILHNNVEIKYTVAFYKKESFKNLIFEEDFVYGRCYPKPSHLYYLTIFDIKLPVRSVISSASCLAFFINANCDEEQPTYAVRYGSYPNIPENEIDLGEFHSFKIDFECSTTAKKVLPTPSERGLYHQPQANSSSGVSGSGSIMSSWMLLLPSIIITLLYI